MIVTAAGSAATKVKKKRKVDKQKNNILHQGS
jgi:hypothetical protein